MEQLVYSERSPGWKIGPLESPDTALGNYIEGRNSLVDRYKIR